MSFLFFHASAVVRAGRRLAAALLAGAVPTLHAVELGDRVDVHGFAHQAYTRTRGNVYAGSDLRGGWNDNFGGLVAAVTLTEKSKLWMQLEGSSGEGVGLTWLFVDYQLDDAARLHAGRVRLPLGFYNETVDVKALQLSTLEPLLYQTYETGADMVHDAYHGVGLDYEHDLGGSHLLWQVWGGNMHDVDPPEDSRDRRAWGGRVTWNTPINGLTAMLSAYRTRVELLADRSMTTEDRVIASLGYTLDALDLKAEYARRKSALRVGAEAVRAHAWYAQAGYTFAERWTPFVRYDSAVLDAAHADDPSYYQRTLAVGLGYRVNPKVVLRVENHLNRGYALPVASGDVAPGTGARRWNLLAASVAVAF